MPTPAKPVSVLKSEGKSHRTKAELGIREQGEQGFISGIKLKEENRVKQDKSSHKEFTRLKKLLKSIEKDDDIYGAVINRYCILRAEEKELELDRKRLEENIKLVNDKLHECNNDEEFRDLAASLSCLEKTLAGMDRRLQSKRKMQAEIERENAMTIASALRSIPKKPAVEEDPLLKALNNA